jgi:hypothetical protein
MKISKTPASLLLSFSAYLAFSSGLLALDNLSGTVTSADALSYEDVIVTGDLNLTGNGILFNGDISSSGPPRSCKSMPDPARSYSTAEIT